MNYVDLFSGAGGLSLGFEKAGFKNIFAVEHDKQISKTYKKNFPDNNLLVTDIKKITESEINDLVGNNKVDVVVGGPPCQGFSLAGKNGRTFVDDERNYLFKEFIRFVSVIKPKMFVMENVARMASHNKGETIKEIKSSFEELGYIVQHKVLQAADYGIPQKRQRVFVVGSKLEGFEYPEVFEKQISVKEAIGDLPRLASGQKSSIPNHNAMNHSEQMLKKMSYIKDGGDRKDIPENLRPVTGDIRKYIRYNSKLPSVTVTGDMRKIFHYEQNRALTCRELARLQSFPDDFIFEGNSISVQQQIGNAVPPKLGFVVANEVKKVLR
ncbi:DNA cytosine methyltransferase [Lactococcus taiwanensis]|uniref:DNA cytosine methyltransferase n=1 Tax=Lactococcus taiwanensis TaxID=1151742 RepID=UPI001F121C53|nr:DNA (cytosine-5-)-methyltransferase [Lactococcus taiwanensis]